MKRLLCIGAAHLDIVARPPAKAGGHGNVSIGVGGTACNVALTVAATGGPMVDLLTALNSSAYSVLIDDYLKMTGIRTHIITRPEFPLGAYSTHLDASGNVLSSVSASPVELATFRDQEVTALLLSSFAVVLDCSISEAELVRLAARAADTVSPVWVIGVEGKADRIAGLAGAISGVVLKGQEHDALASRLGTKSVAETAKALKAAVVSVNAPVDIIVATASGEARRIPFGVFLTAADIGRRTTLAAHVVINAEYASLDIFTAVAKAIDQSCGKKTPDISQALTNGALESAIGRLAHRAGHDAMTGAMNRAYTERALRSAINSGAHLSVALIDIDYFKSINDTFGHNVGDDVIIAVANTVKSCLRGGDSLGRWGGEEFILVLPGSNLEMTAHIAERVRERIEAMTNLPRKVTISAGCAQHVHPEGMESLVQRADSALYDAKRGGRNRVICASDLSVARA